MRKILLFLSVFAFGILAFSPVAFAQQKLPDDWMNKLKSAGYIDDKGNQKFQMVILEEDFGRHSLPPELKEFETVPLYRESMCETIVDANRSSTRECFSEGTLSATCNPLSATKGDKTEEVICQRVGVVIGRGGLELLKNSVRLFYIFAASIVGLVAVGQIMLAGLKISTSNSETSAAKDAIVKAFLSLALLFLSGVILYTINPNFFV
jgi:hypothetical protein